MRAFLMRLNVRLRELDVLITEPDAGQFTPHGRVG
jgi:hypothetical protein